MTQVGIGGYHTAAKLLTGELPKEEESFRRDISAMLDEFRTKGKEQLGDEFPTVETNVEEKIQKLWQAYSAMLPKDCHTLVNSDLMEGCTSSNGLNSRNTAFIKKVTCPGLLEQIGYPNLGKQDDTFTWFVELCHVTMNADNQKEQSKIWNTLGDHQARLFYSTRAMAAKKLEEESAKENSWVTKSAIDRLIGIIKGTRVVESTDPAQPVAIIYLGFMYNDQDNIELYRRALTKGLEQYKNHYCPQP